MREATREGGQGRRGARRRCFARSRASSSTASSPTELDRARTEHADAAPSAPPKEWDKDPSDEIADEITRHFFTQRADAGAAPSSSQLDRELLPTITLDELEPPRAARGAASAGRVIAMSRPGVEPSCRPRHEVARDRDRRERCDGRAVDATPPPKPLLATQPVPGKIVTTRTTPRPDATGGRCRTASASSSSRPTFQNDEIEISRLPAGRYVAASDHRLRAGSVRRRHRRPQRRRASSTRSRCARCSPARSRRQRVDRRARGPRSTARRARPISRPSSSCSTCESPRRAATSARSRRGRREQLEFARNRRLLARAQLLRGHRGRARPATIRATGRPPPSSSRRSISTRRSPRLRARFADARQLHVRVRRQRRSGDAGSRSSRRTSRACRAPAARRPGTTSA